MLRKRLIFTLIYNDGFFAQSRNFRLQRVGDIHWLQKNYQFQQIAFSLDELIILNVSRQNKSITKFAKMLSLFRQNVFIPVAVGGGIRTQEDADILFLHGADKVVLNNALYTDNKLVKNLVDQYGSQSIVGSIDYKITENDAEIFIADGSSKISFSLDEYICYVQSLNIGEIYLNSIDRDGTGFGYDIDTIERIKKKIYIPLIIAGGAGNAQHLIDGLKIDDVNAVATANLFNFIGSGLPNARKKIIESRINLATWRYDLN